MLGYSKPNGDKNEVAIKSNKQPAPVANETYLKESKAKAYQQMGNVYTRTGKYKKAIEYYQKARKIFPGIKTDKAEVTAYQWLGYNHLQTGQYQESVTYYKETLELASQLGDLKNKINAYLGLGSAFSNTGELESARKYFLKALTVAEVEEINDKGLQKEAYTNLGHVYYKNCEYKAAVKSYLKVQEMSHDLGEKKEEWHACLMLGHTFRQLKQHENAIESYRKALGINKELEDEGIQRNDSEKDQEGIINEWCGYCCHFIGQHQEAITFYEKAKEIAKQVGDKYQEYRTNQAIGNTLCNIGNYAKANVNYQEAFRIAVKLGDKHCEGTSCLNLASVCSKDCDYEIAIEWYEKALNVFGTEFDDHILKEKALTGLAIAWFKLGNTRKATESVQRAQKISKEETDKGNNF